MSNDLYDNSEFEGIANDIEKNKFLDNIEEGMTLLTRLLSCENLDQNLHNKIKPLELLINDDYSTLADQEDLPNENEMVVKLNNLKTDMEELIKFPFLLDKTIIGIGGGFSAGKSKFINSLLREEILPTDTRPTTSIPTYITKGYTQKIYAYNYFGSKTTIDNEAVKAISHMFKERYNLNFTKILKYIVLQSENLPFNNIAFLDTPGYTKADIKKADDNTDEHIARQHLKKADCLLWLIDIEKGTIPEQDINFIKKLEFQNSIFFIITKSDHKINSQIEDVINRAQKDILNANINIEGIIAYSSVDKKEYIKEKDTEKLTPFLKKINELKKDNYYLSDVNYVFKSYKDYHEGKLEKNRSKLGLMKKIKLYNENDEYNSIIEEFISEHKTYIDEEKHFITEFEKLNKSFVSQINLIIDDIRLYLENEKKLEMEYLKFKQDQFELQEHIELSKSLETEEKTETINKDDLEIVAAMNAEKKMAEIKRLELEKCLRTQERTNLMSIINKWTEDLEFEQKNIGERKIMRNLSNKVDLRVQELRADERIKQIESSINTMNNVIRGVLNEQNKLNNRINQINEIKSNQDYYVHFEIEIEIEYDNRAAQLLEKGKEKIIDLKNKIIAERELELKSYRELKEKCDTNREDSIQKAREFVEARKKMKAQQLEQSMSNN